MGPLIYYGMHLFNKNIILILKIMFLTPSL